MSREIRHSYDQVAVRYADEIGDELAGKPLDRAVLNAFAEMITGPVLDVGGGPGHVAAYLAQQYATVASSDVSHTMCVIARHRGMPSITADMTQLPFASDAVGGIVCFYAVIHLDVDQRAAAYASFRRVLHAGGLALVAFHTQDADHPREGLPSTRPGGGTRSAGIVLTAVLALAGLIRKTVSSSAYACPFP